MNNKKIIFIFALIMFYCTGLTINYSQTENLLLWNKLGSQTDIENSEYGVNGTIVGTDISYEMVQFNNGATRSVASSSLINFENIQLQLDEGCIEFWCKMTESPNSTTSHVNWFSESSYVMPQILFHWNHIANTGVAALSYAGGSSSERIRFWLWDADDIGWTAAGDIIHLAVVWDMNLSYENCIQLYANGVRVGGNGIMNGGGSQTKLKSSVANDLAILTLNGSPNPDRLPNCSMDNIKIWDYAKTDFSDRFVESLIYSYDIYSINTKAGNLERITFIDGADEYNPTFSNNGKKVAHDAVGGPAPFGHSIYVTDIATGVSTLLVGAEGGNDASWSPNGKYIAFDCSPIGVPNLYIVPAGGGERKLLRAGSIDGEWSNNSKRLVFKDISDGSLRTIDMKSGKQTNLGVFGNNASWSNNGKYIAYSDEVNIFVIEVSKSGVPKGSPIQLTEAAPDEFNQQPSWSNNDKTIVFHSNRGGDSDIWTIPFKGGTPTLLAGLLGLGDFDPCFSKNGNNIAYAGLTASSPSLSKPSKDKIQLSSFDNTPKYFTLNQNYPNPFNPTTSISYSIPSDGYVSLSIFDVLGNEVVQLESGLRSAGNYSHTFDASDLPSGIYFYTIRANNFVETKKMLLIK